MQTYIDLRDNKNDHAYQGWGFSCVCSVLWVLVLFVQCFGFGLKQVVPDPLQDVDGTLGGSLH